LNKFKLRLYSKFSNSKANNDSSTIESKNCHKNGVNEQDLTAEEVLSFI